MIYILGKGRPQDWRLQKVIGVLWTTSGTVEKGERSASHKGEGDFGRTTLRAALANQAPDSVPAFSVIDHGKGVRKFMHQNTNWQSFLGTGTYFPTLIFC